MEENRNEQETQNEVVVKEENAQQPEVIEMIEQQPESNNITHKSIVDEVNFTPSQPIYRNLWFIIVASFFTFGLYGLYYYFISRKGKIGILIASAFLLGLYGVLLLIDSLQPRGEIQITYDTYEVEKIVTIPATEAKPAVYESKLPISAFAGDPEQGATELFVGKDIPAEQYIVSFVEADENCKLKLKSAQDFNIYSGNQVYQNQEITISDTQKFSGFNCGTHNNGISFALTPKGEGKILEPATEAKPEYNATEMIIYSDFEKRCYIDVKLTPCENLREMDALQEMMKQNTQAVKTTTEKLKIVGKEETCYINNRRSLCGMLKLYSKLKAEIIVK